MAAYPTLPTSISYVPETRDGRVMDIVGDGLSRIRKLHTDRIGVFPLEHPGLNTTQQAALDAHYAAHLTAVFAYTDVYGVTYNVSYAAKPSYKLFAPDGTRKTAMVKLTQTG